MSKLKKSEAKEESKKSPSTAELGRKVTHLYLNGKYLNSIGNLNRYLHLTVLYLHNNDIDKIENLNKLRNLRGLYLQRNKIKKIENLNALTKLQRLYLGHNEISVMENLENLKCLKELHIEKQRLASGDKLCFDPRSVQCLSNSLEVLNVSGNGISTIQMLAPLKYLRILNASNNNISLLPNITETIGELVSLREASFAGNPISKERRYRETIIGKSIRLKTLDQKDISDITRCFIKKLNLERNNFESVNTGDLPKNIAGTVQNYSLPLQKAISNFMLKPRKASNTSLPLSTSEAYIGWKRLPTTFGRNVLKTPLRGRNRYKRNERCDVDLSTLSNFL